MMQFLSPGQLYIYIKNSRLYNGDNIHGHSASNNNYLQHYALVRIKWSEYFYTNVSSLSVNNPVENINVLTYVWHYKIHLYF